jgi:hypothetical protein
MIFISITLLGLIPCADQRVQIEEIPVCGSSGQFTGGSYDDRPKEVPSLILSDGLRNEPP